MWPISLCLPVPWKGVGGEKYGLAILSGGGEEGGAQNRGADLDPAVCVIAGLQSTSGGRASWVCEQELFLVCVFDV